MVAQGLPTAQSCVDVIDHRALDVKVGDGTPHVLLPLIAEQIQLSLIDANDDSIGPGPVERYGGILGRSPNRDFRSGESPPLPKRAFSRAARIASPKA